MIRDAKEAFVRFLSTLAPNEVITIGGLYDTLYMQGYTHDEIKAAGHELIDEDRVDIGLSVDPVTMQDDGGTFIRLSRRTADAS